MPDDDGRRSVSPDLNPFDAFIGHQSNSDDEAHDDEKAKLAAENNGFLPKQIPSIIDERAIVRYYKDASNTPIIISDGHQGTQKSESNKVNKDDAHSCEALPQHYDVALALDVTTGCGGKIWPAAEVLGQYIAARRTDGQWKGKTAVELGAGTGLVGLLAAHLGDVQHVWITDQIPMLKLMQQNLSLNPASLQERCTVAELNWGEPCPKDVVPLYPDILLLADCVYLEVAFQPLVDTMCEMCTPQTEVLFCYQQRRKADKRFFKMLRKHFTFCDIQDDDEQRTKQYNRQGTHLYRMTKKY